MESLVYIHSAIAYEDLNPSPTLVLWQGFNGQKRPSAGWLKFLWIGVVVAAAISLSEVAQAATVKVKTDTGLGLNVRSAPTVSSNIVGGLNEGDVIGVAASETSSWSKITDGPYVGGYVSNNWIVSVAPSDPIIPVPEPALEKKYAVKTNSGIGLRVRALPTTASGNIGGLGEGENIVAKASSTPGWLLITSGVYKGGYVASNWAVPSDGSIEKVNPDSNNSQGNYTVRTNSGIGVVVRSSPTTASGNIGGLGEGSVVNATPVSNGWLQIISGSYAGGYISSNWAVAGGTINASNPNSGNASSNSQGNYTVKTNSGIGVVVRSSPTTASGNIGGLGEGSVVNATPAGNGWLQITSGSYAGGYISSNWAVAGGTINASNPSYGTGNYVVDTNGGGLIVRSAPSTAAKSIGGLGEGQRVSAVASSTGGWLVINSGPYAGGYISSTWVAPTSNVAAF